MKIENSFPNADEDWFLFITMIEHQNKSLIRNSCNVQSLSSNLFRPFLPARKQKQHTFAHIKIFKMIHLMSFHSITHICYISI